MDLQMRHRIDLALLSEIDTICCKSSGGSESNLGIIEVEVEFGTFFESKTLPFIDGIKSSGKVQRRLLQQLNHCPEFQAHQSFIMYPELLTSEGFTLSLRKSDIIKAQIRPSEEMAKLTAR